MSTSLGDQQQQAMAAYLLVQVHENVIHQSNCPRLPATTKPQKGGILRMAFCNNLGYGQYSLDVYPYLNAAAAGQRLLMALYPAISAAAQAVQLMMMMMMIIIQVCSVGSSPSVPCQHGLQFPRRPWQVRLLAMLSAAACSGQDNLKMET